MLLLTDVKYINSTGLGTIVKCVDQFREQDGDIKLVGAPTKVIALFEMLGLLALFETHDTIEQAVDSFNSGSAEGETEEARRSTAPKAQFPIQFKHPVSGMGLNVYNLVASATHVAVTSFLSLMMGRLIFMK